MRPDRAEILRNAPLNDLLAILLRQYPRLLAQQAIELIEGDIQTLARDIVEGRPPGDLATAVREALVTLVEDSLGVLAGWGLTFEQALKTDMGDMPGWETTAEFLDIANEKGNAELRIASGAVLVTALDDLRYAPHLLVSIAHDPDELEAVVARRLLSRASGVAVDAADWQAQVQDWLDSRS